MTGEAFWKRLAVITLAVLTLFLSERVLRDYLFSATVPRAVVPREDLVPDEKRNARIFQSVAPSVVSISTQQGQRRFDSQVGGSGSGFVWDAAGHVVTNDHVVANASEIAVVFEDGRAIPASLVGTAPWADLAVLKLSVVPPDLKPIKVGSSHDLVVGQAVLAIGNPFGLSHTLTTGIISALDRQLPTQSGRIVTGVVQTDAAINPGNSGGPLVDTAERLIGVNTAIIAPSGTFAGVGFAIPVDTVNRIVPALIKDGRAPLPGIGIGVVAEEIAKQAGIQGIVVASVQRGSAAEAAGLQGLSARGELGDVIVEAEGEPVSNVAELSLILERVGIGNKARLTAAREGREREVTVTVQDINDR
ncbi:MAG: trypsin-like peptidase domain-containing protein [Hyphomicrobium sp.]|nr:trypsin-like peptidase domain-containing protein [Hyphomicrobium sp.]